MKKDRGGILDFYKQVFTHKHFPVVLVIVIFAGIVDSFTDTKVTLYIGLSGIAYLILGSMKYIKKEEEDDQKS